MTTTQSPSTAKTDREHRDRVQAILDGLLRDRAQTYMDKLREGDPFAGLQGIDAISDHLSHQAVRDVSEYVGEHQLSGAQITPFMSELNLVLVRGNNLWDKAQDDLSALAAEFDRLMPEVRFDPEYQFGTARRKYLRQTVSNMRALLAAYDN